MSVQPRKSNYPKVGRTKSLDTSKLKYDVPENQRVASLHLALFLI